MVLHNVLKLTQYAKNLSRSWGYGLVSAPGPSFAAPDGGDLADWWTPGTGGAIFPPIQIGLIAVKQRLDWLSALMLTQFFAWWDTTTFGTSFTLWRRSAALVGRDEQGNRYYEEKKPSGPDGYKRRWVVYNGIAEGSRVPSDWHGWMHHTFDEPPTVAPLRRQSFEKDHLPNMTGTPLAYHPPGSLSHAGGPAALSDYEAWTPEQ